MPVTMPVEQGEDRIEIIRVLRAYHTAMVDADTAGLDDLLDEEFALVHITGYVQPKDEWFGVLRSGEFDYHRIEIDDNTVSVSIDGRTAEVRGRGIFNATINGMRNPWRLQFTVRFARRGDTWIIAHARYTSF
jgi:hypothetical protein